MNPRFTLLQKTLLPVLLVAPLGLGAAGSWAAPPSPLEQSVTDFEARQAFDVMGPPTAHDAARARGETALYEAMVENFEVISDDEDDLATVLEAFSAPVDEFRPHAFRVEDETAAADDPFADDPLPQATHSSSSYVTGIRPSFMPGAPLAAHRTVALDELKGGAALFGDAPPKPASPPAAPVTPATAAPATVAGHINAPPPAPPKPSTDQETLQALQKAVKELQLQGKINFQNNSSMARTLAAPVAEAPVAAVPPPPAQAGPKAKPRKHRVRRKKAAPVPAAAEQGN